MRELIKRLRADAGISQRDFAARIGVSESMVARVETGDRVFGFETVETIITEFGLSKKQAEELKAARKGRPAGRPADDWRREMEDRVARIEQRLDALAPEPAVQPARGRVHRMPDVAHRQAADTGDAGATSNNSVPANAIRSPSFRAPEMV